LAALAAQVLTARGRLADLIDMCEAVRVVVGHLSRNGRGARILDFTLAAGHVIVSTILILLASH